MTISKRDKPFSKRNPITDRFYMYDLARQPREILEGELIRLEKKVSTMKRFTLFGFLGGALIIFSGGTGGNSATPFIGFDPFNPLHVFLFFLLTRTAWGAILLFGAAGLMLAAGRLNMKVEEIEQMFRSAQENREPLNGSNVDDWNDFK